jgi:hypothetical protein
LQGRILVLRERHALTRAPALVDTRSAHFVVSAVRAWGAANNDTGRVDEDPARTINIDRLRNELSAGAAASPRQAATAASAATAATSPAAAAPAAAATATTPPSDLLACLGLRVFLVEDVERRQADVRDFLLAEEHFVTRRNILLRIGRLAGSRSGSSARHSQRYASDSQNGYGFTPTLSLGSLFHVRHLLVSHTFKPGFTDGV